MTKRWLILLLVVLVWPIVPAVLGQGDYPRRNDPLINDYAALLTTDDAAAVRTMLTDLQTAHGVEAVVVTIGSINDYATGDTTIESFATGLFNTWGIGDKTRNDGVLLLVAVKDHQVRIELGSGYGSGPSGEMQAVIDRYVLPKFRANAYSSGILIGTQAMIAKLTDQPMPETGDIPPTRIPSVSTSSGTTSTRTNSGSSLDGLLVLAVAAMGGYAIISAMFRDAVGESDQDDQDSDDDHRRSSWTSSSYRSSSSSSSYHSSSSSSRSSSSSSKGGGSSSGGGASGSW